jgi:hypothetical protein
MESVKKIFPGIFLQWGVFGNSVGIFEILLTPPRSLLPDFWKEKNKKKERGGVETPEHSPQYFIQFPSFKIEKRAKPSNEKKHEKLIAFIYFLYIKLSLFVLSDHYSRLQQNKFYT